MPRGQILLCMVVLLAVLPTRSDARDGRTPTLERDVEPILTRYGCNAGACHGKQRGQNGFQLSLFGFDPAFDLDALAREARGRRIFPASPEQSLLLLKATARLPHGGGKRLEPGTPPYDAIRRWIVAGTPRDPLDAARLVRIAVDAEEKIISSGQEFPLKVTAHFSDGAHEDVTGLAAFQSNESAIASISPEGRVKAGTIPGEVAITARFRGQFATCYVTIPLPGSVPDSVYDRLPRRNKIDGLVWAKLRRLGITPSGPAGDSTYLRRVYLDIIGRLPSVEEARAFLSDKDTDKRAKLVERLLERPEYADHWASKWMDLLRPNPYRVGIKAVFSLDAWIRQVFRRNLPYDEFVRQVVAARGSTWQAGAATVFRDRREPEEAATTVSQLFLGIRLECAKCHHHPFEVWGQEDFYGFAACFARIGRKGTGLSPPISGGEEIVYAEKSGSVKHPLTGKVLEPRPLFGSFGKIADRADPRAALASWITAPENRFFARVIVNRVWSDLMGRGIVEPVDDLRATNPPSNGPLLDALADDFREHRCDLKHLISTIATSHVYGLSSTPTDRNVADTRNYSRHYRRRLGAEVVLNAVCDITGVPETFQGMPPGTRADGLWTVRAESLFLDTFGRPDPNQDPPCERRPDSSVVQALHLMNAPGLHAKITSDSGLPARLAASKQSPRRIAEELYLRTYSRFPTDDEASLVGEVLEEARDLRGRRAAVEDLLWALINTPEFLFKD
jgi:hypothetical protein